MKTAWLYFLLLTLCGLTVQGFFSMLEMATLSFNRIRLQYFVSKRQSSALYLSRLLQHPTRLFGTTLIVVNSAMQFGSEAARRFYSALGLSPDWALPTQLVVVLIFAELAPMFAARRYPQRVALFGAPILYWLSLGLRPVLVLLDLICRGINRCSGRRQSRGLYLSRDELQKAIETREPASLQRDQDELFNPVLDNLFSFKEKVAQDLMQPIDQIKRFAVTLTVGELKEAMALQPLRFCLLYAGSRPNIVGVLRARDLIGRALEVPVASIVRPPWVVAPQTAILKLISSFQRNKEVLALVQNIRKETVGCLPLDSIVDHLLDKEGGAAFLEGERESEILIDCTLPAHIQVAKVNTWLDLALPYEGEDETLESWMENRLGHPPADGEVVVESGLEISVEQSSLLSLQQINLRSLRHW